MKKVILTYIIWLVIINLFALVALNRYNLNTDSAYQWISGKDHPVAEHSWNPIPLHAHWDSWWYVSIADKGYYFKDTNSFSNIIFFPLYPALIFIVSLVTNNNFVLAGWIVSTLALLGALFYLYKLVKKFHPALNPQLPILFLLIFPTSFFLNAVYAESLFLLLSICTFYYALGGKWFIAGLVGLLAALTRPVGILLFLPLLWEYIYSPGWRSLVKPRALSLLLIPLGTASFFTYHYLKFNDWLLFFKMESLWGRAFKINYDHFALLAPSAYINLALDVSLVAFAVIATYLIIKNIRVSYGLYIALSVLVPIATGTLMSIGRYILVLFPIYILGASLKNEIMQRAWIFISILLFSMYITLFVANYWAG